VLYSREKKYFTTPGPEWKREYLNGYKINRGKVTFRRSPFQVAFRWYDSRVDRIIRCPEILNNVIFMGSAAVAMMGLTALGIPQLSIGRSDHPINLSTDSLGYSKAIAKILDPYCTSSLQNVLASECHARRAISCIDRLPRASPCFCGRQTLSSHSQGKQLRVHAKVGPLAHLITVSSKIAQMFSYFEFDLQFLRPNTSHAGET
jgi:hypothetical protein